MPLADQAAFLANHGLDPAYALFWEQGVGKSYALILNAATLALGGEINAALVLAPNGVHRNWTVEELPKSWPEALGPLNVFAYDTNRAYTSSGRNAIAAFLKPSNTFRWLTLSYDAMMTPSGAKVAWDFLRHNRCLYIADESQRIKTPGAKRTQRIIKSAIYAPYRRLASGTPMDSPFDIYAQLRFLDPAFWMKTQGIGSYTAFKSTYGVWQKIKLQAGRDFDKLIRYTRQDELERTIATISSRVTKDQALDLPPKTYVRRFHPLSPEARAAYNELKAEALTILASGELVTAELALTLDLRLQQIGCGHVAPYAGAPSVRFARNPRADLLATILEDTTSPTLIWCQFVEDTRIAAEASRRAGRVPAIYDATAPELSVDRFHRGEVHDLIGTLASTLTEGYTLTEASTVIYYSRSPKLIQRQQSEDRAHRLGSIHPVTYIDLLAEHTLDAARLNDLREKREIVGGLMGDDPVALRAWLREALEND